MITRDERTNLESVVRAAFGRHEKHDSWCEGLGCSTCVSFEMALAALTRDQAPHAPCPHADLLRRMIADGDCIHAGTDDGDGGCTLCTEARVALSSPCAGGSAFRWCTECGEVPTPVDQIACAKCRDAVSR